MVSYSPYSSNKGGRRVLRKSANYEQKPFYLVWSPFHVKNRCRPQGWSAGMEQSWSRTLGRTGQQQNWPPGPSQRGKRRPCRRPSSPMDRWDPLPQNSQRLSPVLPPAQTLALPCSTWWGGSPPGHSGKGLEHNKKHQENPQWEKRQWRSKGKLELWGINDTVCEN